MATDEERWFASSPPAEQNQDEPVSTLDVTPTEQQKTYQFSNFAKSMIEGDLGYPKMAAASSRLKLQKSNPETMRRVHRVAVSKLTSPYCRFEYLVLQRVSLY